MSNTSVLTKIQQRFLELFGKHPFSKKFSLTGGTALAALYIPYRYSEDLDFFSENEVRTDEVIVFLRSIKGNIGFKRFDFNTSFNRNVFFLRFPKEQLKLEFTYYPFPPIGKRKEAFGIAIDSVEDIAVNKLFTIYQNPRSRDFMDLYMIIKKYHFPLHTLIKKAKVKFDWHVDPLQLGSQFLLAKDIKDYPRFIDHLEEKEWQAFFLAEAKKLEQEIISQ